MVREHKASTIKKEFPSDHVHKLIGTVPNASIVHVQCTIGVADTVLVQCRIPVLSIP